MENIKKNIKEHYGKIATDPTSSCCCSCSTPSDTFMSEQYAPEDVETLARADLGLGCGTPAAYAGLRDGMTVLDLGSGAGIDVFIAAKQVGRSGKVIGIDMTEEMIQRARRNAEELHVTNADFLLGEIEDMPVNSGTVDRVISNCVLNLVPDKRKAFSEIYRVLNIGGSFVVSDIVIVGTMPQTVREDTDLWSSCIGGAIQKDEYVDIIRNAGFRDIQILNEKTIDSIAAKSFTLISITITGKK